ncbi:hypothetical protein SNE40_021923 [Patella caerulea]|uniref:Uncharacterized protein n=1 Tax=Patella caerulea TaxID=87958 RepID=A0AAN8GJD9_PATCE
MASRGYIAVTSVHILALIFQVVGFVTPYWQYGEYDKYFGLFRECTLAGDSYNCSNVDLGTSQGWVKATVSLEGLTILVQVLALLALIAYQCRNESRFHAAVAVVLLTVAGVIGLSGVTVYGYEADTTQAQIYWSFALEVVASVLNLIVAVFLTVIAFQQTGYVPINE